MRLSKRAVAASPVKTSMRLWILALVTLLLVSSSPVIAQPWERRVVEAFKLVESLSEEQVNVSAPISLLNKALELYRQNKTEEADALVAEAAQQLGQLQAQLPSLRLYRWASLGATVAMLGATPLLFYYFFPRVYALVWAYSRRRWLARVRRNGNRR